MNTQQAKDQAARIAALASQDHLTKRAAVAFAREVILAMTLGRLIPLSCKYSVEELYDQWLENGEL